MMGKVLVRKNQDAANLVSSLIGSGPKTNLGAALGGGIGGLSFLTGLRWRATTGRSIWSWLCEPRWLWWLQGRR